MTVRTLSIQLAQPTDVPTAEGPFRTAMLKQAVDGPVMLEKRGLAGDGWANLEYHGHEDQAICVYPSRHFADLATELGLPELGAGGFGDNFTVAGIDEESALVGAHYRVGEALVEVTKPRSPCSTLNRVWGNSKLAAAIGRSARTGWYLRVLEAGVVQAGDAWQLVQPAPEGARSIAQSWRNKSSSS